MTLSLTSGFLGITSAMFPIVSSALGTHVMLIILQRFVTFVFAIFKSKILDD